MEDETPGSLCWKTLRSSSPAPRPRTVSGYTIRLSPTEEDPGVVAYCAWENLKLMDRAVLGAVAGWGPESGALSVAIST